VGRFDFPQVLSSVQRMETQRPWYKKKRYIISAIILGLIWVYSTGTETTPAPIVEDAQVAYPTVAPVQVPAPIAPARTFQPEPALSNDNYYTNTYGNEVHSPAYADSVPSGASAVCGDGNYSFSQSRSGTCSHHGGVDEWL
jgi:hypothetical protein